MVARNTGSVEVTGSTPVRSKFLYYTEKSTKGAEPVSNMTFANRFAKSRTLHQFLKKFCKICFLQIFFKLAEVCKQTRGKRGAWRGFVKPYHDFLFYEKSTKGAEPVSNMTFANRFAKSRTLHQFLKKFCKICFLQIFFKLAEVCKQTRGKRGAWRGFVKPYPIF